MGFKYHLQDGIEYASYARSVRNGKKVVTEYTYLGKVIDKQKGLFFNRKLGYIVFDTDEKRIMPAPNGLVPSDSLEDESAILDFGDSFFLDEYMESQGINRCIGSMGCTETDMLCTLIVYYTLTHKKVDRIKRWYDGNYISQLHPGLDLRPERIVEFMN